MTKKKKVDGTTSIKSKTFTLELYPEWGDICKYILSHIMKEKYWLILHDKDKDENGEIKKAHIHVVIEYGGRRNLSSVKNEYKEYEMPSNLINTCNKKAMLRYLIHKDDLDKYPYPEENVQTNAPEDLQEALLDELSMSNQLKLILKYIDEKNGYIEAKDINNYVTQNGYYSAMTKFSNSMIKPAIYDHNKAVERENRIENIVEQKTAKMLKKGYEELGKIADIVQINGVVETTVTDSKGKEIPVILTLKAENEEESDEKENKRKINAIELWEGIEK